MGKGTMVGIIAGLGAILVSMIMEGGNPASLIFPPALLLITVGTFGAACAGTSLEQSLDALKSIGQAFTATEPDRVGLAQRLGGYADEARRDGILALETKVREEPDPVLKAGLTMLIDGDSPASVLGTMKVLAGSRKKVWDERAEFFNKMGGYAPTLGIIGTVLGLIHTLESLGGDPAELGHLIAAAFIATFFGVTFANIIFLPVAAKFKQIGGTEVAMAMMAMSGIESLASGETPRALVTRLAASLPEAEAAELTERKSA
jgi:chemotaxis protein MotA